jgi:hypothetical protein
MSHFWSSNRLIFTPFRKNEEREEPPPYCSPVKFAILEKKEPDLQQVNQAVLQHLRSNEVEVEICRADELEVRRGLSSELDEMWSFVKAKTNPR